MIDWISGLFKQALATVGAFFAGFITASLRAENKRLKREASDAEKDLEIAMQPLKRGSDLTDGL